MDPLPPYWIRYQTESGVPYYFNQITRKTQWEPPTVDGKTAAAAETEGAEAPHSSRAVSLQSRAGGASTGASTAVASYGASGDSPESGAFAAAGEDKGTGDPPSLNSRSLEEGEGGLSSGGRSGGASSFWRCSPAWCLDRSSLQRLFEVETSHVKNRLLEALVAGRGGEDAEPLLHRPDLYGPFWIAATLALSLFTCGCLPLLLERPGAQQSVGPDSQTPSGIQFLRGAGGIGLLSFAAFAVYAALFLPVGFYWLFQTFRRSRVGLEGRATEFGEALSLPQLLCMQGYAASPACLLVLFLPLAQSLPWSTAAAVLKGASAAAALGVSGLFFLRQLRHVRLRRSARHALVGLLLFGQAALLLVVLANAPHFPHGKLAAQPALEAAAETAPRAAPVLSAQSEALPSSAPPSSVAETQEETHSPGAEEEAADAAGTAEAAAAEEGEKPSETTSLQEEGAEFVDAEAEPEPGGGNASGETAP